MEREQPVVQLIDSKQVIDSNMSCCVKGAIWPRHAVLASHGGNCGELSSALSDTLLRRSSVAPWRSAAIIPGHLQFESGW